MAIRAERFTVKEGEVRGVSRVDSKYNKPIRGKDGEIKDGQEMHSYTLEIYLHEQGSIYVDYEEDEAARDADYELVDSIIP